MMFLKRNTVRESISSKGEITQHLRFLMNFFFKFILCICLEA